MKCMRHNFVKKITELFIAVSILISQRNSSYSILNLMEHSTVSKTKPPPVQRESKNRSQRERPA